MRRLRPIILCGGSGARLRPVSSVQRPKQFLKLKKNDRTMLQETALRFKDDAPPIVVTAQQYADEVRMQLEAVGLSDAIILAEPLPRNTAPAIGLALYYMQLNNLQDEDVIVLPSDHLINNPNQFRLNVLDAQNAAANSIVLFGVEPKSSNTQYGYIEVADNACVASDAKVCAVSAFKEKPNKIVAASYLRSGRHYWNSGIFLMGYEVALAAYREFAPALWYQIQNVNPLEITHTDYEPIVEKAFDRLILEYAPNIVMRKCTVKWADIGNWPVFIRHIFGFRLFQ
ncbi:MAG: sugar phosphate nucleotidyltransferase [Pseudomonadota bacterium]|nr:sugar phosphate nucleotidyltransferase [Pseudomonadota bacterium]MEC9236332.1 sugar phosphate nucleotidyltransferase [Pseudomonadota bacterium]MED5422133.1 sugar phosphate nucleotidyltransferase [Pseudomonadota bacterium]MEE3322854.1 sugar phosphate nucleotidyltransferase [Pseudomonadota bacterium]